MAVTREQAEEMVHRYLYDVGLTKEETFDPEKRVWYWRKGSARMEVFIQEVQFETHYRYYLRVFSPIATVPEHNQNQFYKTLLEMNDSKLGVKLSLFPGTAQIYATSERDIKNISYEELSTCIRDLEWWADILNNELTQQFFGSQLGKN